MASTSTEDGAPPTKIIKSDRTGRLRYTQEFKDEVLAGFEASGMSGPDFAAHCGVKYPTFAGWAAKRRRGGVKARPRAGEREFVLATFGGDAAPVELRVELPGGARARLATADQAGLLAALIRALA